MNNEAIAEIISLTMGGLVSLLIVYAVFRFFVGYPSRGGQCSCESSAPKRLGRKELVELATALGITVRDGDKRSDLERKVNIYRDRVAALGVPVPPPVAVSLAKTADQPELSQSEAS